LYLCALFQVFDGAQVVGLGILRGIGDVRTPLFFHLFAYWVVGIPLSLWLAFTLGYGVQGIWIGLAIALAIVAILSGLRIAYWMNKGVQSLYTFQE
jgi:multidrug resistance protein, MATE family